jgi:hypothetical protein
MAIRGAPRALHDTIRAAIDARDTERALARQPLLAAQQRALLRAFLEDPWLYE